LKQKQKKPGRTVKIRRTTPEERQRYEDASWALADEEVQAKHEGHFVVPYRRRIVAFGFDPQAVQKEAARVTGTPIGELPLVAIVNPLQDMLPDGFGAHVSDSQYQ